MIDSRHAQAPGPPRPRVVTEHPLNFETPLPLLDGGVTPTASFYVRNNFPAPELDAGRWSLRIHGEVRHPRGWTLEELQSLEAVSRTVTLECAGNGRRLVDPPPPGTPWGLGAAGTASFTGIPLGRVLAEAGVADAATTCVFSGADAGEVEDGSHRRFQRSLALSEAMGGDEGRTGDPTGHEGPLLAWAMNGAPLTPEHGYPVRLVVPRWYAVASVKWLVEIEVTREPFHGWFQTDRYTYRRGGESSPVRLMRVRSLITSHPDGTSVPAGTLPLAGVAWSGAGPLAGVEVQVDGGPWIGAALPRPAVAGVAAPWECPLNVPPGLHRLRVRAFDTLGGTQPDRSEWNELGYGNNGIHEVHLRAE